MQQYLLPLFILLSLPAFSTSQNIGCNVVGACVDPVFVAFSDADTPDKCLRFCQTSPGCAHFTHYADSSTCFALVTCPSINPSTIAATSGDVSCAICHLNGRCDGTLAGVQGGIANSADCLAACLADNECAWWSHNTADDICILTKDCLKLDETCLTCVSGQRDCQNGGSGSTSGPGSTTTRTTTTTTPPTTTGAPRYSCTNVTGVAYGELVSRNYPSNYPNYDSCLSRITVTAGWRIRFSLQAFRTENTFDFLRIYNGPNTTSPLLASLTGSLTTLPTYNSTGNQMYFAFTSDSSNTYTGFRGIFEEFL